VNTVRSGDEVIINGVSPKYAPIEFEDSSVMEQLATEAYADYFDGRTISNVKFLGTRDGDLSPYFSFILHDFSWEYETPKDWLVVMELNARFEAITQGAEDVAYVDYLDFDNEMPICPFVD